MNSQFNYGIGPSLYSSNQSDGDEEPLIRNLRGILRRKWIVLAIFSVILALTVVYTYTRVPIYRSTATIRVSVSLPTSGDSGFYDYFTNFTLYYETVTQGLKTGMPAGRGLKTPTDSISLFREEGMDVNANKGTPFITLAMNANEPTLAKQQLQHYLDNFIKKHREDVEYAMQKLLSAMETDLKEFQAQMIKSQTELQDFSIKHELVLSGMEPYVSSSVDRASDNLLEIRGKRLDLEIAANQRQGLLPRKLNDDYLIKLKNDCNAMKTEYNAMSATYTPDYVNMRILKSKIDTFDKAISDIEGNLLNDNLAEAKRQEVSAKEVYDITKRELMAKSPVAIQFSILKREADADAKMYLSLKDKLWHAKFYSNMMVNSLEQYSPPTLPIAPIYPNKTKFIGLGVLLGLVGGLAVAFFLDRFDKTSRHIASIQKNVNLPMLGVVPLSLLEPKPSDDVRQFLARELPISPFADALCLVHFAASQLMSTRSGTAVCITSSLPAEGKTLMSLALANTVALEGKKVLVVDGDMRKHRASDLFGARPGTPGLSDLLTDKLSDIHQVISQSGIRGVYFISSGPAPENPVALLKNRAMQECIAQCKKDFDFVVIDSPPVLGMVDALVLGGLSDGVILVVKHGATSVDLVRQAERALLQANVKVVGTVVNMVKGAEGLDNPCHSGYFRNADYRSSRHGATIS